MCRYFKSLFSGLTAWLRVPLRVHGIVCHPFATHVAEEEVVGTRAAMALGAAAPRSEDPRSRLDFNRGFTVVSE